MKSRTACVYLVAGISTLAAFAGPVKAQTLDTPAVVVTHQGHGKIALRVTAGPSGAPFGFTIYWMTREDFDSYGDVWPDSPGSARLGWASYYGFPTLNTDGGVYSSFVLSPSQTVEVELGDNRDETGVATDDPYELLYSETWGVPYVFTAFANSGSGLARSLYAGNLNGATQQPENCTLTQGFWKNHPSLWPVTSVPLGTVTYTQTQLLQILNQPGAGNGLLSLAHQLIAAKLNLADGASSSGVASAIAAADALIDGMVVPPIGTGFLSPSTTSTTTQALDDFNNGLLGSPICASVRATGTTWGALKARYR